MPKDSLTIRVSDFIFDYIRDKGLSTGEVLPSEMRTSTELNISRGVVREAFRSLEVAGIIEKKKGCSPRVGVLNSGFLKHLMVHAISTKQISARQVLELRCPIEVLAAELAAQKHTPSDLQRLRSAVDGMRKSVGNLATFVEHDLNFHDLINRASGNPLIEVICEAIHKSVRPSMRVGILKRIGEAAVSKVVESHEAIVDAIDEGNVEVAKQLMKKHFDNAQAALAGSIPI